MLLEKAYDPKQYEDKIYKAWERSGLFTPKIVKGKKPFVIMMPPPNATGTLHLGHAIMLALEDIMVRFHRMKGDPTLWLPGTDHAAIATQNKVEKLLVDEGLTRQKLGREKFLERVHAFVKESQNTIRNQIRKMGSSCDWSRERYTLEPMLSRAVREIFVRMYTDGLIYRGDRIVNWCPRCASTLADDEVEYKEEKAKFYYLKYGPFIIGTARPETKFLDKVIVVHPDDKRYKKYIGKVMTVPWIEGDVKATILADSSVDPKFGSGAMTITPGHDFVDFEIAKRHKLEIHSIIDEQGNLTDAAGSFAGKNARQSREAIIKKLQRKGLVQEIDESYVHNISLCYRCNTPIEPLVSKQWFIAVDKKFSIPHFTCHIQKKETTIKELALHVVKNGAIKILPAQFEKTYFHWILNLHDWCISRQIWFGHQIPVWYCVGDEKKGGACKLECRKPFVQTEAPKKCPHCGSTNLKQDPDTLDTWFSSGLWTFSTLGWPDYAKASSGKPKKTKDLEYFHPTSVLETGYDILFFWVARMIIMTTYAMGEIPFEYVYLHGLVRTREGKKMSKSDPSTCIDPLDMIQKYGADALRLSMVIGSAPGNDIRLYEEKIAGFRNFVNKIWNAARFAMMQDGDKRRRGQLTAPTRILPKTLADKWILTRTQQIIKDVTDDLENFRFSDAGMKIYDFTWGEYCAWYLEISKGEQKNLPIISYVLDTILALLHPFVPFVSEAIWKHLKKNNLLIAHPWPQPQKKFIFTKEASQISVVLEVISSIRNVRHESGINPKEKIRAVIISKKWKKLLEEKREPIMRLAKLASLTISEEAAKIHPALSQVTKSGVEILIPADKLLDIASERKRLEEEKTNLDRYLNSLSTKLKNKQFASKAPQEIVAAEKEKFKSAQEKLEKISRQLQTLTFN